MTHALFLRASLGLALPALLAAAPAAAAVSATAWMGAVSIRLVDLRPFDGIAPSLSFQDESSQARASRNGPVVYDTTAGLYEPADALLSDALGEGHGFTGPDGLGAEMQVDGRLPGQSGTASGGARVSAGLWLGPGTRMVLTAPFEARAVTTIGADAGGIESANVLGSIQVTLQWDITFFNYLVTEGASATYRQIGDRFFGDSDRFAGPLRLVVSNWSDRTLPGSYVVDLIASGSSPLAPVPEPASVTLWLAGLGLLARRIGTNPQRR